MDATEAMEAMEAMEATENVFISLALYASLVLVEPVGARHSERNTPSFPCSPGMSLGRVCSRGVWPGCRLPAAVLCLRQGA